MKKTLAILGALAIARSAHAQGTILFQYFGGGAGEVPIFLPNGTTPADSSFSVQLFLSSDLSTPLATTTIFQNTGLFQYNYPDSPEITVPGVAPGSSADLTLRV